MASTAATVTVRFDSAALARAVRESNALVRRARAASSPRERLRALRKIRRTLDLDRMVVVR